MGKKKGDYMNFKEKDDKIKQIQIQKDRFFNHHTAYSSYFHMKSFTHIPLFLPRLIKIHWEAYNACRRQWNERELERIQSKRLRRIIIHSYKHVEFYHKQYSSIDIDPNNIKTAEDLSKLPVFSKDDLRNNFSQLIATNFKLGKCVLNKTSGSTGEPTRTLMNLDVHKYYGSRAIRERLACGVKFGDKVVNIFPSIRADIKNFMSQSHPKIDIKGFNKVWSFTIPRENKKCLSLLNMLIKLKPNIIFGAPSTIRILAHVAQDNNISEIHPKVIISSFELLDKSTRQYITNTFNSDIIDVYGSSEVGDIAWECPEHAGYHINMDDVVIEILKDGEHVAEGEKGEIVVTGLHNYAMPIIRYKIGDVATLTRELCPCGRKLPLLKNIEGRIADFIILPNGQLISPYALMNIMNYPMISMFQIIQETTNKIVILFVEDVGFNQDILNTIEKKYREILGDDMDIELVNVDSIEKYGKLRPVIRKFQTPIDLPQCGSKKC